MTDKVKKPRRSRKKEIVHGETSRPEKLLLQVDSGVAEPVKSLGDSDHGSIPSPAPTSASSSSLERYSPWNSQPDGDLLPGEHKVLIFRNRYPLPTYYQPSLADAFDQLFISHFIALNTGVRSYNAETPWVALLPGFSNSVKTPALKYSIRAASMALYAKVHQEPPILVDSYRWYGYSLQKQHRALAKLNGSTLPSQEECTAPLILGLYEVYAGTSPSTVFQHLAAAARILSMRGPRNCSSDEFLPLFIALRVSDVGPLSIICKKRNKPNCHRLTWLLFSIGLPSSHHPSG